MLYLKLQSVLVFCGLLVLFGSLDVIFQTVEIIKNEDTSYEDLDMVDETQRLMFLGSGMMMILGAMLLHLLHHIHS